MHQNNASSIIAMFYILFWVILKWICTIVKAHLTENNIFTFKDMQIVFKFKKTHQKVTRKDNLEDNNKACGFMLSKFRHAYLQ